MELSSVPFLYMGLILSRAIVSATPYYSHSPHGFLKIGIGVGAIATATDLKGFNLEKGFSVEIANTVSPRDKACLINEHK